MSRLNHIVRSIYSVSFDFHHYAKARAKYKPENRLVSLAYSLCPKSKRILIYPEPPSVANVSFKILACLGYSITSNPRKGGDVIMRRLRSTYFDEKEYNYPQLNLGVNASKINSHCKDITKENVQSVFESTFGYPLGVDPRVYKGKIVAKSNLNASHDGRVLQGPLPEKEIRKDLAYQKHINNITNGIVCDIRVPIHGSNIPLVYIKERSLQYRFSNKNDNVEITNPTSVLNSDEIDAIMRFARSLRMDYGEIDVLRDKEDGRVYVVDANKTPFGPPNGLTSAGKKKALEKLIPTFECLLEEFRLGT